MEVHEFAPLQPGSTKCKWCSYHEQVHPITEENMPLQKHVFKARTPGSTTGCDVPGCAKPMSDRIHHALDRGAPETELLPNNVDRISRDQMLVSMAEIVRRRSTCLRGQVGVVIAHNGRVASLGYNGSPPGMPHCCDDGVGCESIPTAGSETTEKMLELYGCQRSIHAEANAIAWAARAGVPIAGATMYSTHSPCGTCAKMIVSAGIASFVYVRSYRAERLDLLEVAHVKVIKVGE